MIGPVELLIVGLICIVSIGVPVVALVLFVLLNERVKRIEARLNMGGEGRRE